MATPKKTEGVRLKDQLGALRNIPRFFQMIWNTSKGLSIANILLRIVRAVIPVSRLYVYQEAIDEILKLIDQPDASQQYLWLMVGLELGLVLLSSVLGRANTLVDILLGDLFSNRISVDLIRHAARLDLYQFENPEFYDKLERARQQTSARTALMSTVLSQFQDFITIISLAVGIIAFNPWLLLLLVVAVLPSFLGETRFNQRRYSLSRSWTPERRELDYLRYIGASDETAKEVKIFNLADFLATRFETISTNYYKANRKLAIQRASVGVALSAIGTVAYYGAYVYIILQTIGGAITVGKFTFLAGAFRQLQNYVQSIMSRFSSIADSALYLKDLFDFFAIEPTIKANPGGLPFPEPLREGFTLEQVSFKYPGSDGYALQNVSFHLRAGEKLALVGENGAGKTTLVKLLARLYEPSEGRILIDGVDIQAYNLTDLRRHIGIIFQDYIRFQMKVADNIAVGDILEIDNDPLIAEAADKSLARDVIDQLPLKFEQVLGKRFKNGVDLSGGQWQKIALARAYMRDAQLLILDEPTAALDARAEHEVFQRFSELITGKTAVLISHRFSTVRMADRILVLENGRKKELGTHEELLAMEGRYAELFHLQAQGYL